jgi:hypothetical protein
VFIQDLRQRVIGAPEISSDGFLPYQPAIRAAFATSAYGQITKTSSVTDLRRSAAHRCSPAEVIAVEREAVNDVPVQISTSYVERSHLTLRMATSGSRRSGSIGDLLDTAPVTQPIDPVVTAPDRRRTFRVIEGGR